MKIETMRLPGRISLFFVTFITILNTGRADDPIVKITSTTPIRHVVDLFIKSAKDSDAFITCAVTNKPQNSQVKWIMNSLINDLLNPISTDMNSEDPFKYSLEKPSQTEWRLKIQNVQVTDEGRYKCRVQIGPQTYMDSFVDLRVTEVPQIADLETSSDTIVKEGDSVRLTCNATGRPFPIVSWRRLAGELLPNGGQELQEYILDIPSVKPQHSGVYKCDAKNLAGSDSRNIVLQVKFAPQVRVNSPKVGQHPGYVKDLICYVTGFPQPKYVTWTHVNNPMNIADLTMNSRFTITNIRGAYNRITSILTIRYVQPIDFGIYKCKAINEQGDDEEDIELIESDVPTPDRSGRISQASLLTISLPTIVMLLSTCMLHRLH